MSSSSRLIVALSAHALYQASLFQGSGRGTSSAPRGVCLQPLSHGIVAYATNDTSLGAAFSPLAADEALPEFDELVLDIPAPLRAELRKRVRHARPYCPGSARPARDRLGHLF